MPHVEQKNWTLVRKLIGYARLETIQQLQWLNALYLELLRPYNNCFQPVMKLITKERREGRLRKLYDVPKTPLQRVLNSSGIPTAELLRVQALALQNPLELKRRIDRTVAAKPALLEVSHSA